MRRLDGEQGVVLVSAVVLLTVMLGLGLGLLFFDDEQQKAAGREQASETAFNLAEAALNAQVGQLSRAWPGQKSEAYPDSEDNGVIRCVAATSTETNGCPASASLGVAYPGNASASCPAGTAKDAWGSPLTNSWTTYVRDDAEQSSYFNSSAEQNQVGWDRNESNRLWVRAVGVAQCRVVTVVTLVSRQLVALNFPHAAVSGNWFKITNNGKKTIVNTAGEPPVSQPGEIGMRCEGLGSQPCESWDKSKEQVSPDTTKSPPTSSVTLSETQLASMRAQAQAAGTLRTAARGNCPSSVAQLSGLPAYVEGCGALKLTDGVANSSGKPGFLVLADGTLELRGNAEFFGIIYARNATNSTGAVVVLGGTTQVIGGIDVDGNGGIEFGSSKANLIYNPKAINELKTYAGTTPTRNTFRVLSATE
jgi:Tfp pilus assembly protein PilX